MTPAAFQILALCPREWTALNVAARQFPMIGTQMTRDVVAKLHAIGKIELRTENRVEQIRRVPCPHDRLNEEGQCRSCGADCREIGS